ncbi:uncharacterized protein [Procambarus clarkii]|uniref:uncharacterized protein n=1 Tax=Procambarus clarkii TaxID=6728 RepID=UPI003743334E
MVSFDVTSCFTNVSLHKILDFLRAQMVAAGTATDATKIVGTTTAADAPTTPPTATAATITATPDTTATGTATTTEAATTTAATTTITPSVATVRAASATIAATIATVAIAAIAATTVIAATAGSGGSGGSKNDIKFCRHNEQQQWKSLQQTQYEYSPPRSLRHQSCCDSCESQIEKGRGDDTVRIVSKSSLVMSPEFLDEEFKNIDSIGLKLFYPLSFLEVCHSKARHHTKPIIEQQNFGVKDEIGEVSDAINNAANKLAPLSAQLLPSSDTVNEVTSPQLLPTKFLIAEPHPWS